MNFLAKPDHVYIGRREMLCSGHWTWYALCVQEEHKEAWLRYQRQVFPHTEIFEASDWPNNGTILADYDGPPHNPIPKEQG